jgi:molybdopterin molybdotransferase
MRTPAQALSLVLARSAELAPLPAERVPLAEALGRALAAPLRARRSLPPFAAATMDGYALRSGDARRPGAALPVAFEVAAGHPAPRPLPPGGCCRIYTGAPLPAGADAVEMQERVARRGAVATFERAAEAGRFVRPMGDDVPRGAVALPAGAVIDPGAIGLAAALGSSTLQVRRRPRVLILPTGDEIVPLGTRPGPGQIVESNAHMLAAAVTEAGGRAELLPAARDDRAALQRALRRARGADLLLTTGGVSVGERDLVRQALGEAGARLDLWRVAMRPGKPLAFGRLGRTLVFGLPGNPASALVTFELFVRPALRLLAGLPGSGRLVVRCRLARSQERSPELTIYLRARAVGHGPTLELLPLRTQTSGNLSSAAGLDALAILPPGRGPLGRGAVVEALLLRAPDQG